MSLLDCLLGGNLIPKKVSTFLRLLYISKISSWTQTVCTLIRLLPVEQSDLGPYCLQYRLPKNISRREEQMTSDLQAKGLKCNAKISGY